MGARLSDGVYYPSRTILDNIWEANLQERLALRQLSTHGIVYRGLIDIQEYEQDNLYRGEAYIEFLIRMERSRLIKAWMKYFKTQMQEAESKVDLLLKDVA